MSNYFGALCEYCRSNRVFCQPTFSKVLSGPSNTPIITGELTLKKVTGEVYMKKSTQQGVNTKQIKQDLARDMLNDIYSGNLTPQENSSSVVSVSNEIQGHSYLLSLQDAANILKTTYNLSVFQPSLPRTSKIVSDTSKTPNARKVNLVECSALTTASDLLEVQPEIDHANGFLAKTDKSSVLQPSNKILTVPEDKAGVPDDLFPADGTGSFYANAEVDSCARTLRLLNLTAETDTEKPSGDKNISFLESTTEQKTENSSSVQYPRSMPVHTDNASTRTSILSSINPIINPFNCETNYPGMLNEIAQKSAERPAKYQVVNSCGPGHLRHFEMVCTYKNYSVSIKGHNTKSMRKKLAFMMLEKLDQEVKSNANDLQNSDTQCTSIQQFMKDENLEPASEGELRKQIEMTGKPFCIVPGTTNALLSFNFRGESVVFGGVGDSTEEATSNSAVQAGMFISSMFRSADSE